MRWLAKRLSWLKVPVLAYLAITLGFPVLHGAARRADFVAHALWVVGGCLVIIAITVAIAGAIDLALVCGNKVRDRRVDRTGGQS